MVKGPALMFSSRLGGATVKIGSSDQILTLFVETFNFNKSALLMPNPFAQDGICIIYQKCFMCMICIFEACYTLYS